MPIEIRELVIKTTIVEKQEAAKQSGDALLIKKKEIAKLKTELLELCNETISKALRQKRER
jgi:hypothetical protein